MWVATHHPYGPDLVRVSCALADAQSRQATQPGAEFDRLRDSASPNRVGLQRRHAPV
jgi:hypothetical protein